MVLRVTAGVDGGIDDVGRRREVGFAGTEPDDVLTGGLEGLRLRVDGEGGGRGDGGESFGGALHGVTSCQIRRRFPSPVDELSASVRNECGPRRTDGGDQGVIRR